MLARGKARPLCPNPNPDPDPEPRARASNPDPNPNPNPNPSPSPNPNPNPNQVPRWLEGQATLSHSAPLPSAATAGGW